MNSDQQESMSKARRFWDWVDERNIDLHVVMFITLYLTVEVIQWAMHYADTHDNAAATMACLLTPWGAMQAAMFNVYTGARK